MGILDRVFVERVRDSQTHSRVEHLPKGPYLAHLISLRIERLSRSSHGDAMGSAMGGFAGSAPASQSKTQRQVRSTSPTLHISLIRVAR